MGSVLNKILKLMDLRFTYEHLMCDAFNAKRLDYHFVNAGYYDSAGQYVDEAFAFLLCALINIKNVNESNVIIIDELIERINNARSENNLQISDFDDIIKIIHEKMIVV